MMDWTDRHCRVFHRLLTRRTRLYTEMLTTGAVIHGGRRHLLGFDPYHFSYRYQGLNNRLIGPTNEGRVIKGILA